MGLRPKFTKLDISRFVGERLSNMEQVIVDRLKNVGMQFVIDARTKVSDKDWSRDAKGLVTAAKLSGSSGLDLSTASSFQDRTGNLRSSIGFVILKDGQVIEENFELSKEGTDKKTGLSEGQEFANKAEGIKQGYSLIVVAGMQYAVYVEAMGYDVLTGSSLKAEENMKDAVEFLKKQQAKR